MKKLFICCLLIMSFFQPVRASGIPTLDIASVQQALTSYIQDLANYQEYMQQTLLNESQLAEAIKLYEQAMVSYDHMLRQMESLKNKLDAKDWEALATKLDRIINRYPGADPTADANWETANETIGKVFNRGDALDDLETTIDGISFESDGRVAVTDSITKTHLKTQIASNQQASVMDYQQLVEQQASDLNKLDETRLNLGDEDQLKTMQFLAEQNQKALELQVYSLSQQTTALQYSNQLSAHIFEKQKENEEADLKGLKAKLQKTYNVNEEKLTTY